MELTFSRQTLGELIHTTVRNLQIHPLEHEIEEITNTAVAQLYGWVLLGQKPTNQAIVEALVVAIDR
jgi:hypothetical protein